MTQIHQELQEAVAVKEMEVHKTLQSKRFSLNVFAVFVKAYLKNQKSNMP